MKILLLLISHLGIGAFGFALGIYMLPILIAPTAPSDAEVNQASSQALFNAEFKRDLQDSDGFHWGEGQLALNSNRISFMGELAPGPDYKVYLSPEFVETEADFMRLKPSMLRVGEVKTFDNFIVELNRGVDLEQYNSVIIWCETFGEFITSARYR